MGPTIKFIGKVKSHLKNMEDCPLQGNENAPEAELVIFSEFIDGVKDLMPSQEILVLTWLYLADRSVIKCYPRNNRDAPLLGVFATRSPSRPNPIGIHPAKIISISPEGVIIVSGMEALDQTPIIDIKPLLKKDI